MASRPVAAKHLVEEFGFTSRHWIRMAAAGRVPGARQPFGPGSSWVFDLPAVRRWWDASTRTVAEWPTSTSGGRPGGGASRKRARSSVVASRRDLKASRASVLRQQR